MKKIELTKGKFAIVDNEDYQWLNQWKWYISKKGYAVRRYYIRGSGKKHQKNINVYMHILINQTPKGFDTDHIDRNSLNNQKSNLRTVSHSQNMMNSSIPSHNTSGIKGVSWRKDTNKWQAFIYLNRKKINLGCFLKIQDAIISRIRGEKCYHIIGEGNNVN